jgi:iron-sulfur cluster assembly protein
MDFKGDFKKPLTLTDAAAQHVKALMETGEEGAIALRVGVKTRGCSGMSYFMEYAREQKKFEEVVEDKGVKIFIDPAAIMFIIGTEMDWVEDEFQSQFVFNNPNEKARCGCGESFSV